MKTRSVIFNGEPDLLPVRRECHRNMAGLRVLDGIVHRLLSDAEQIRDDRFPDDRHRNPLNKLAGDPMSRPDLHHEFFERRAQPAGFQRHQVEPPRHRSGLGDGFAQQLGDLRGVFRLRQGLLGQFGRQPRARRRPC